MIGLIWTMIVGVIVGTIAKAIMPGEEPGGLFVTMMLGVGGALVGRWIARVLGVYAYGGISGLLFAVLGAMAILWVWGKFIRKDPAV